MGMMCPDCPPLLPLNDKNGLLAVDAVVKNFNENTSNAHYFVLKEVGRIRSGVRKPLTFFFFFFCAVISDRIINL